MIFVSCGMWHCVAFSTRKGSKRKLSELRVRENLGLNQQIFDLGMKCGEHRMRQQATITFVCSMQSG